MWNITRVDQNIREKELLPRRFQKMRENMEAHVNLQDDPDGWYCYIRYISLMMKSVLLSILPAVNLEDTLSVTDITY